MGQRDPSSNPSSVTYKLEITRKALHVTTLNFCFFTSEDRIMELWGDWAV